MALTNCPECDSRISDKAAACPHCGAPVEETQHNRREIAGTIDSTEKLLSRKRKSTAAALLLIGSFATAMYILSGPTEGTPPMARDPENPSTTEAALARQKTADAIAADEKKKKAQQELAKAQKKEADEQRTRELIWIAKGQDSVRKLLRDEKSARFSDIYFHRGKDGLPVTCGKVNSKNGFGGYGGYQRFISGGTPELTYLEEKVSDFHIAWKRLCQR